MLLGGLWRHQLRRGACQDLHAVNNALLKREEGNQLAQGDNLIGRPASGIWCPTAAGLASFGWKVRRCAKSKAAASRGPSAELASKTVKLPSWKGPVVVPAAMAPWTVATSASSDSSASRSR